MNDYQRGQLDMRERCAKVARGKFEHLHTDVSKAIEALPLTAPATEAGGLGAEAVAALLAEHEAVRVECAKFNFPDEDRPGIWEAHQATVAALARGRPGGPPPN